MQLEGETETEHMQSQEQLQFVTSETVLAQHQGPASKLACEVDGRDETHL